MDHRCRCTSSGKFATGGINNSGNTRKTNDVNNSRIPATEEPPTTAWYQVKQSLHPQQGDKQLQGLQVLLTPVANLPSMTNLPPWQIIYNYQNLCHWYQLHWHYTTLLIKEFFPLPPLSLILLVHLQLQVFSRFPKNNRNDHKVIIKRPREYDSWKNLARTVSWHCPFNRNVDQDLI